jgi:hypothetical protein
MRILLIDDQPETVEAVIAEIKQKLNLTDDHCKSVTFDNTEADIALHNPQIIVLDLLKQVGGSGEAIGLQIHAYIWKTRFCPLIFYTAAPDLVAEQAAENHPFIKVVKKGANSEALVLQCIQEFEPHIRALDEAEREIRSTMNGVLREIAPKLFEGTQNAAERNEMLVRSARRRVAAKMDEALLTGESAGLKSWECYLYPPVVNHLLMGDVIRKRNQDTNQPENYAVVLTPSCDLVKTATRNPKVPRVLVSRCANVSRLLPEIQLQTWPKDKNDKNKGKLVSLLTTGYGHSSMPLPALPGVFPSMAIDFRRLELIDIANIGDAEEEYERVVSVDNPWRELLAWAYMLSSARPGMPDRDYDAWAAEIIALFPAANN